MTNSFSKSIQEHLVTLKRNHENYYQRLASSTTVADVNRHYEEYIQALKRNRTDMIKTICAFKHGSNAHAICSIAKDLFNRDAACALNFANARRAELNK